MSKSPILKLAELLDMPEEQRRVIYRLGRRALDDGRVAEAIETLEVATQLSPHDAKAWRALADAYREGFEAVGGEIRPGRGGGSTDMGNVTQVLPGLHPHYRIPATSGNHTRGFTDAAETVEAHEATIRASKALALAALRAFEDTEFLAAVHSSFASGETGGR